MEVAVIEADEDTAVDSTIVDKPKKVSARNKQCPHCGVFGHVTTKSKYCLALNEIARDGLSVYEDGDKDTDIPLDNQKQAAMEISLLDQLPCATDGLRELEDSLGDEND